MSARKGLIVGCSYAFSMLGITSLFLVIVQYGTTLYLDGEIGLQHVYTTFFLIIIGSLSLGQLSTYYVDFNGCDESCERLFGVLHRVSKIDGLEDWRDSQKRRTTQFNHPNTETFSRFHATGKKTYTF